MKKILQAALFVVPVALAACAQQEEAPMVIKGEPIFNKYGDVVGCESGVYVPGAQMPEQCMPPSDGCDPTYGSNNPDCYPGREQDEPDRDPQSPNSPTGGPV